MELKWSEPLVRSNAKCLYFVCFKKPPAGEFGPNLLFRIKHREAMQLSMALCSKCQE